MGKCAIVGMVCPRTNNREAKYYCPYWTDTGVIWTNTKTKEERFFNCAAEALMPTCIEVIKAANRPAAEVAEVRKEIVGGFQALCEIATKRLEMKQSEQSTISQK